MKKLIMLLLVMVVLLLALTSCDGGGGNSKADSSTCLHENLSNAEAVKDATCTEPGIIGGTCSRCDSYVTKNFPAYGHNFVGGFCTVCGAEE